MEIFKIVLSILLIISFSLTCDSYNITEPRFFGKEDIVTFPDCVLEEDTVLVQPKLEYKFKFPIVEVDSVLPAVFEVDACWQNETQKILKIYFTLPVACESVNLSILGSGANSIISLIDDRVEPGRHWVLCDGKDKMENGVYAIWFKADNFEKLIWFEIN